ncbi:MAG: hypothetical protein SNJ83_12805, partial [Aggregatilineales bacterium]
MTEPLRVLFVSPTSQNIYGAEKALYKLIERLPRDRIAPSLLVLKPIPLELRRWLEAQKVKTIESRFRGWCYMPSSRYQRVRRFMRLADNLRVALHLNYTIGSYDLIYSNTTSSPIGAMIAMFRACP